MYDKHLLSRSLINSITHLPPILCFMHFVQIWPLNGYLDDVYNTLKDAHPHLKVYKKEEIPEDWHNSKHRRIPPLFLVADMGWVMTDGQSFLFPGHHGYNINQSDLWGTFLTHGPSFKQNLTIPGFPNVNVYQVLCHVADVECRPHNGSWHHVCAMFKEESCNHLSIERKDNYDESDGA